MHRGALATLWSALACAAVACTGGGGGARSDGSPPADAARRSYPAGAIPLTASFRRSPSPHVLHLADPDAVESDVKDLAYTFTVTAGEQSAQITDEDQSQYLTPPIADDADVELSGVAVDGATSDETLTWSCDKKGARSMAPQKLLVGDPDAASRTEVQLTPTALPPCSGLAIVQAGQVDLGFTVKTVQRNCIDAGCETTTAETAPHGEVNQISPVIVTGAGAPEVSPDVTVESVQSTTATDTNELVLTFTCFKACVSIDVQAPALPRTIDTSRLIDGGGDVVIHAQAVPEQVYDIAVTFVNADGTGKVVFSGEVASTAVDDP
jgi:hypothetical protein